jgi:hypothetical protein
MEAGPPGAGCRTSPQNTRRCVGMRSQVVSGPGKGGARLRQVWTRKANKSEPLMRHRKGTDAIETRLCHLVWDAARKGPVYGPGGGRCRSGASLVQAPVWNVGTERPDVKGEARGETLWRASVPKRDDGADWLVGAMRPGNAGGAKGPGCPASEVSQPNRGGVHA